MDKNTQYEVPEWFFHLKADKPKPDLQDKAFTNVEPFTDEQLDKAFAVGDLIRSTGPTKTPEQYEKEKWDAGRERKGIREHIRAMVSRRR